MHRLRLVLRYLPDRLPVHGWADILDAIGGTFGTPLTYEELTKLVV
jgi:hypothetical protein